MENGNARGKRTQGRRSLAKIAKLRRGMQESRWALACRKGDGSVV
jgi:hypothetical protein